MFSYLIPKFWSHIGFTPLSIWLAHIVAAKIVPCFKFSHIPICFVVPFGESILMELSFLSSYML